jgi:hypothetical protein
VEAGDGRARLAVAGAAGGGAAGGGAAPAAPAEVRDVLALPLAARGSTLGVVAIGRHADTATWSRQDVELATDLARRATAALDNARLYEAAQRATRSRDDMLASRGSSRRRSSWSRCRWTPGSSCASSPTSSPRSRARGT